MSSQQQQQALDLLAEMRKAHPEVAGWDVLADSIAKIVPLPAPITATAQLDAQDYYALAGARQFGLGNWAAWHPPDISMTS